MHMYGGAKQRLVLLFTIVCAASFVAGGTFTINNLVVTGGAGNAIKLSPLTNNVGIDDVRVIMESGYKSETDIGTPFEIYGYSSITMNNVDIDLNLDRSFLTLHGVPGRDAGTTGPTLNNITISVIDIPENVNDIGSLMNMDGDSLVTVSSFLVKGVPTDWFENRTKEEAGPLGCPTPDANPTAPAAGLQGQVVYSGSTDTGNPVFFADTCTDDIEDADRQANPTCIFIDELGNTTVCRECPTGYNISAVLGIITLPVSSSGRNPCLISLGSVGKDRTAKIVSEDEVVVEDDDGDIAVVGGSGGISAVVIVLVLVMLNRRKKKNKSKGGLSDEWFKCDSNESFTGDGTTMESTTDGVTSTGMSDVDTSVDFSQAEDSQFGDTSLDDGMSLDDTGLGSNYMESNYLDTNLDSTMEASGGLCTDLDSTMDPSGGLCTDLDSTFGASIV